MMGYSNSRKLLRCSAILIASTSIGAAYANDQLQFSVTVPTKDGTKLAADVYLPTNSGKHPVLFQLTPYNKKGQNSTAKYYTSRGYAVVVADSRGIYASEGTWTPYVNDGQDGYDIQQWIGQQTWSNGKIGMFGCSYPGFTQLLSAPYRSEYLKAILPECAQSDNFSAIWSTDGLYQIALAPAWGLSQEVVATDKERPRVHWGQLVWHLPLKTLPERIGISSDFVSGSIEHYSYGDFWKRMSIRELYHEMDVPAFHTVGWYDDLTAETIRNFVNMRKSSRSEHSRKWQKLLIGPWDHGVKPRRYYGDLDLGPEMEQFNVQEMRDRWFDYHLKGEQNGLDKEAPIKIFVMGANKWRDEWDWPLERAMDTRFYLHSDGFANTLFGNGRLSPTSPSDQKPDQYRYDPNHPVMTYGGHGCCPYVPLAIGPFDQRATQLRNDVLVYTSETLTEDVEVTGQPEANLAVSSDVLDTDFFVTLSDVYPDGRSIVITEGSIRGRFRDSFTEPKKMTPGEVMNLKIPLWGTSNVFKKGHKIRVHITSSNFPRYARNLNSGKPPGEETADDITIATQNIHHDEKNMSWITLPLVPVSNP